MKKSTLTPAPLAIDLALPFLQRLTVAQRRLQKPSVSALIREALDEFNVEAYEPNHPPHLQISVRLPVAQRKALRRIARARRVSVGELVRVAVENFLAKHPAPVPVPVPTEAPVPKPKRKR